MQSKRDNFTVVPILVGSLSPDKEVKYGRIFAKYLADPSNLFIISSDFCHWGQRFRYTEYDETKGQIHESIKALDFEVIFYVRCRAVKKLHKYLNFVLKVYYIFISMFVGNGYY